MPSGVNRIPHRPTVSYSRRMRTAMARGRANMLTVALGCDDGDSSMLADVEIPIVGAAGQ